MAHVVEGVLEILEEHLGVGKPVQKEMEIVGVQGVRDYEKLAVLDLHVVGEVIVAQVRVVEEAPLLGNQLDRPGARLSAVPPKGSLSGYLLGQRDSSSDLLDFLFARQPEVFHPSVTVAADFMPSVYYRPSSLGICFKRLRNCEEGGLDVVSIEKVEDSPNCNAGFILEDGLHGQITIRDWSVSGYLSPEYLRTLVPEQDIPLTGCFVVDSYLQSQPFAIRPLDFWRS